MSAHFSVLDEPWLPAVTMEGETQMYGLRELFAQAHQLRALTDASPLVEYGLYRLLCVFLMDALRPQDELDLEELLAAGSFDMAQLDDYFARCRQEGCNFDLFDPERPFLQTPYRAAWDKTPKPASTLDVTIPNGNNHTHFDHRRNAAIGFSYAQAARFLPAVQLFCTAGAQGYPSGPNGAPPYYAVIVGENLFETLVLSMVGQDSVRGAFDVPPAPWRSTIEVEPKKQVLSTSCLYGMLFPARRVLLVPEEATKTVRQVYFSQGMNYLAPETWTDPHVTYRWGKKGRFAWRPQKERPPWRNLQDLVSLQPEYAPQIVRQFPMVKPDAAYAKVLLYGVQTEQASYLDVMRHDLEIPVAAMKHPGAVWLIGTCVNLSEQIAFALAQSLGTKNLPPDAAGRAQQQYYTACERMMWDMCSQIPANPEHAIDPLLIGWIEGITQEARDAYAQTMETVVLRGAALTEAVRREGLLIAAIRKMKGAHNL